MLDEIWHKIMKDWLERQRTALAYIPAFTPYCLQELREVGLKARQHKVHGALAIEARVIEAMALGDMVHIVNLQRQWCTCRKYQENYIPCSHGLALILHLQYPPQLFLPSMLSTETWRQTYITNFRPVLPPPLPALAVHHENPNNQPGDVCLPPQTRIPRGRPKKQRLKRGEGRHNVEGVGNLQKCSTCGSVGHNARTCKRPHV